MRDTVTHSSIENGVNWSGADQLNNATESWAHNGSLTTRFNSSSDTGTHSSIEKGINWSRADPLIRNSESWAQNGSLPIRFNSSSFCFKQKLSESML
ncbi:Hypothetical predicted protein [Mytilus galloprovincialis]|uniref:Uncharacterized protein n=1 Tax=Mytilus galloprovincialis TaxID=29158 RepID=A0A8B6FKW8_MYTGA|nr:Hypothetical predicted protein [Mytilus galloprovincialis]